MSTQTTTTSGELDIACLADNAVVAQVRALVKHKLAEWGEPQIAPDVCLIGSELVTNALERTPGEEIRVRLKCEDGGVLLGVWDSSDEMPIVSALSEITLADVVPDPEALDPGHEDGTGGRGLPIVEALSSDWKVERTTPHGKWVWSRVSM